MKIGTKTFVAFPKDDYKQAIVWDYTFELQEFIKYVIVSILLVIFGFFVLKYIQNK